MILKVEYTCESWDKRRESKARWRSVRYGAYASSEDNVCSKGAIDEQSVNGSNVTCRMLYRDLISGDDSLRTSRDN